MIKEVQKRYQSNRKIVIYKGWKTCKKMNRITEISAVKKWYIYLKVADNSKNINTCLVFIVATEKNNRFEPDDDDMPTEEEEYKEDDKKEEVKKDDDVDSRKKDDDVDSRKKGRCYKCGLRGHQAKSCKA
ncbi:---NA---, partial [Paramuricea clavata]